MNDQIDEIELATEQLASEQADLYCPECNRWEVYSDYELGIADVNGIRTDRFCGQCRGLLYIQ